MHTQLAPDLHAIASWNPPRFHHRDIFPYKPSMLGYPLFWKPQYLFIQTILGSTSVHIMNDLWTTWNKVASGWAPWNEHPSISWASRNTTWKSQFWVGKKSAKKSLNSPPVNLAGSKKPPIFGWFSQLETSMHRGFVHCHVWLPESEWVICDWWNFWRIS